MRSRSLDATLRPGPSTLVAGAAIAVSIVLAPVLPDPVLAQSTTGDTRSAPAAKASPSRGATAAQAAETLPAWLGEFERGNVTDFEPRAPGLGAGLRYSLPRRGARADVFLYDRNSPVPISEDAASGPVRDEFARTMREVEGFYRSRNQAGRLRESFALPPGLLCAEFEVGQADGRANHSLACVGGAAGRYVKVRLTMPAAPDASALGRDFARGALLAARGEPIGAATTEPGAGGQAARGGGIKIP